MGKYKVPKELYDRILALIDFQQMELERLETEIVEAKAYGDLSENATYEVLRMSKSNLTEIYEFNLNNLEHFEVASDFELKLLTNGLYRTYDYEISYSSKSHEILKARAVLVPPTDIKIVDGVSITSPLGIMLASVENSGEITMQKQKTDVVVVKVKKIRQYEPERIVFLDGKSNIYGSIGSSLDGLHDGG